MRLLRKHAYKGFCGLLVALSLAVLPLPAMADTTPPGPSDQPTVTITADQIVAPTENTTPATTPPETSDAPVTGAASAAASDTTLGSSLQATTSTTSEAIVSVGNVIDSTAQSGNALVLGNETAGNATSGSATAQATVLNVVNANGTSTPGFNTFQCDFVDDSEGDVVIDPTSLLPVCKTTSVGASTQPTTSTQGLQTGASLTDILNNIVLSAASGDATVGNNETAGNATTGNATTLANIVNIANTNITSQHAFLGIINIFGTLKGNILVPQALVDGLAGGASGSGLVDTTSITNNISADAQSGDATVKHNETAGDATSGNATTNITVLNLTGQQVVAKNSLLVFVNVLGKWLGMIVPAPGSSTTAMLGSGVQGSNSTGGTGTSLNDAQADTTITNNVTLQSRSGDATVHGNETAGSATSGNAAAGANLLNITNSNFVLDDWFGALFINVLGTWLGNFDVQAALAESDNPDTTTPEIVQDVEVYQFAEPTDVTEPTAITTDSEASDFSSAQAAPAVDDSHKSAVLSANTQTPKTPESDGNPVVRTDLLTLIGLIVALTILIATGTLGLRHKLLA